jgi:glycosyltransferase involved in cell wall biosynthesis
MNENVLLSICCVTYNHEKYIAQAIESFINQKVSFPIEIIIHDDASTDNTQNIIKKHAAQDKRIRPILRTTNIKSTGVPVFPITYNLARSKYLALCEGDDYWTDPYKLQKQVDFMEQNVDFSICGHKTKMLFENDADKEQIEGADEGLYTIEDLTKNNFIPTSSVVFRKEFIYELPDWFLDVPIGDWALFLLLAQHGEIKMFDEVMSVHRIHSGGIWTKNEVSTEWHKQWEILMKTLEILRTKFADRVNALLTKTYYNYVFKLANYHLDANNLEGFQQITKSIANNPFYNASEAEDFLTNISANIIRKENEIERLQQLNNQLKSSKSYKIGNALIRTGNIFRR